MEYTLSDLSDFLGPPHSLIRGYWAKGRRKAEAAIRVLVNEAREAGESPEEYAGSDLTKMPRAQGLARVLKMTGVIQCSSYHDSECEHDEHGSGYAVDNLTSLSEGRQDRSLR